MEWRHSSPAAINSATDILHATDKNPTLSFWRMESCKTTVDYVLYLGNGNTSTNDKKHYLVYSDIRISIDNMCFNKGTSQVLNIRDFILVL